MLKNLSNIFICLPAFLTYLGSEPLDATGGVLVGVGPHVSTPVLQEGVGSPELRVLKKSPTSPQARFQVIKILVAKLYDRAGMNLDLTYCRSSNSRFQGLNILRSCNSMTFRNFDRRNLGLSNCGLFGRNTYEHCKHNFTS